MSSLLQTMEQTGAELMPFGPPLADGTQLYVAADFGAYELEYAAVRRYVGIVAMPQKGVIELSGGDRVDFLHRLLTQDIKAMQPGQARRALLLDAKGRIQADVIVSHTESVTRLELDRFDIAGALTELEGKLFAEDVSVRDVSGAWDMIALMGPAALTLWQSAMGASPPATDRACIAASYAGHALHLTRWDQCGVPALRVHVPTSQGVGLWRQLLASAGHEEGVDDPEAMDAKSAAELAERRRRGLRGRPVGWSAYNTARVESGEPAYHIDFGPDCLPAEAGLLDQAVSFTKGCYTGQEAVARMKALGHPKRLLVGLTVEGDAVPPAGTPLFEPDRGDKPGREIGAVTSSAPSPLRGGSPVALAMVRWGRHEPETQVVLPVEGRWVPGRVIARESLLK